MTAEKEKAALMLAQGRYSAPEIAAATGISLRSIFRYKQDPEFLAAVEQNERDLAARIRKSGLAVMANRLRHKMLRHQMLRRIVARRRHDPTVLEYLGVIERDPESGEVLNPDAHHPAEAGMLLVKWKGKDADRAEFSVDTGLAGELDRIEQDIAIEVGDWKTRHELTGAFGEDLPAALIPLAAVLTPAQLDALEQAAKKQAKETAERAEATPQGEPEL